MEWRDEGIILGTRRHGETSAIVEVMTRAHGRHLGVVRGGRSKRMQPMLQVGNHVALHWWARLDEHLGSYQIEPLNFSAARLIDLPVALFGIQLAAAHLRLLPERDPHENLYQTLALLLDHSDSALTAGELLLRFEIVLLEELGFGLDLSCCAATGTKDDLIYVSPKSGRAVSRDAGAPWAERLLAMPQFMRNSRLRAATITEICTAFQLTGFFFNRHVWEPRGQLQPEARSGFISALTRACA